MKQCLCSTIKDDAGFQEVSTNIQLDKKNNHYVGT